MGTAPPHLAPTLHPRTSLLLCSPSTDGEGEAGPAGQAARILLSQCCARTPTRDLCQQVKNGNGSGSFFFFFFSFEKILGPNKARAAGRLVSWPSPPEQASGGRPGALGLGLLQDSPGSGSGAVRPEPIRASPPPGRSVLTRSVAPTPQSPLCPHPPPSHGGHQEEDADA